jgi:hypothetical protein
VLVVRLAVQRRLQLAGHRVVVAELELRVEPGPQCLATQTLEASRLRDGERLGAQLTEEPRPSPTSECRPAVCSGRLELAARMCGVGRLEVLLEGVDVDDVGGDLQAVARAVPADDLGAEGASQP